MSTIYLDFNRKTPVAPSVLEAMQPYFGNHFYLPSQQHPLAQAVTESLEQARESVSFMIGCDAFEVVFTASGTEANNLAILGTARRQKAGHILVSSIEHDSVTLAAESLQDSGWQVESISCDQFGLIDVDAFAQQLRDDTALVCVQLANPVIGTVQPIRKIADFCHKRGCICIATRRRRSGRSQLMQWRWELTPCPSVGTSFMGLPGAGPSTCEEAASCLRLSSVKSAKWRCGLALKMCRPASGWEWRPIW